MGSSSSAHSLFKNVTAAWRVLVELIETKYQLSSKSSELHLQLTERDLHQTLRC